MKFFYLYLSAILFVITSCSGDADIFSGVWQSVNDPSKQIIFAQSGDTFTFETSKIASSFQGIPGTYNSDENALVFDNGNGATTKLIYDASSHHILGLGEEFERTTNNVAETKEDKEAGQHPTEIVPAENAPGTTTTTNCDAGEILVISGNNVRVRHEPDLTKQNILFQVHKGYEVVRLNDRIVDGQKWYKVCYDGNFGWVSGQYAAAK